MNTKHKTELFLRDLGNGLVLRRASVEDAEALADINGRMHSDDGPDKPDRYIAAWVRDLAAKPHPTLCAGDFTVVEETATGRIVSTLCSIPQTWKYEGIEFSVGRPELVCTLPEFRRRGLVRTQMEEVHKWGAERGDLAQVITGIPNYYRQFGYEMTLDLAGRRLGYEAHVPKLKEGETEPFVLRPAKDEDADFILSVYEETQTRYAISCKRTLEIIKYEIGGQSSDSVNHFDALIIEDKNGKAVGYIQHPTILWSDGLYAVMFELVKGVSWLDVSPSVARYLWAKGGEYAARDSKTCYSWGFSLGTHHPVYEALEDRLPVQRKPYAFYIHVPDMAAFLTRVKPALEKRLAESIAAGYTGELKINFYTSGVRMVFKHGKIATVESYKPMPDINPDANFPELTFLHLLFGHRSLDDLRHVFADCYLENNNARVLLNALFPKRLSDVFALC